MLNKMMLGGGKVSEIKHVEIMTGSFNVSKNGGRQLVKLDSGRYVCITRNNIDRLELYKSDDKGRTWSRLCYIEGANSNCAPYWCISTDGIRVHILYAVSNQNAYAFIHINGDTQIDQNVYNSMQIISSILTAVSTCSLAVSQDRTKICAVWTCKSSLYSNSYNIQACRGTIDNISGNVTFGGASLVSFFNDSTYSFNQPSVIYNSFQRPIIAVCYIEGSRFGINEYTYDGTGWGSTVIVPLKAINLAQAYPSITFMPSNVSTKINSSYINGLVIVAWHGKDNIDNNVYNIRCKASSDGGQIWFDFGIDGEKITSGNSYFKMNPSVCWNNDGKIFIVWQGADANNQYNIYYLEKEKRIINVIEKPYSQLNPSTILECQLNPAFIFVDNADFGDKSLLHFNGTQGSQLFIDESGKTWTVNGNAQISTAQSKFGSSSYFNGLSCIYTESIDYYLVGKSFTIDFWIKIDSQQDSCIAELVTESKYCFRFDASQDGHISFSIWGGSATYSMSGVISNGNWHHIAAVGTGLGLVSFYIDGIKKSYANTNAAYNCTDLYIGCQKGLVNQFTGYIDEFRFTKGVVRWTENFTPPTKEGIYFNQEPSVDFYG